MPGRLAERQSVQPTVADMPRFPKSSLLGVCRKYSNVDNRRSWRETRPSFHKQAMKVQRKFRGSRLGRNSTLWQLELTARPPGNDTLEVMETHYTSGT
jgi:hypothetical protein